LWEKGGAEMTREEAKEEIKRWTPILLNSGQCTEKTSEAQDMAISALDKSSNIEKIRAEIAEIPKKYPMTADYESGIREALSIIDKHVNTETWNGYHGTINAPKGTFEKILAEPDDGFDI
jgi:hypothetical protein